MVGRGIDCPARQLEGGMIDGINFGLIILPLMKCYGPLPSYLVADMKP